MCLLKWCSAVSCCGTGSHAALTHWCDSSLLQPPHSSLLPSALENSYVKAISNHHAGRKMQSREKGISVRPAGHTSSQISPFWGLRRKRNIARAHAIHWGCFWRLGCHLQALSAVKLPRAALQGLCAEEDSQNEVAGQRTGAWLCAWASLEQDKAVPVVVCQGLPGLGVRCCFLYWTDYFLWGSLCLLACPARQRFNSSIRELQTTAKLKEVVLRVLFRQSFCYVWKQSLSFGSFWCGCWWEEERRAIWMKAW